ncbi:MAG: polyA polymerase, poly(A) polymerase [Candidatus Gottesmanbacteria bacterium GW2011_GWA2_43_14]|uniref:PolyA polymerase, poly(A) polymerase n=1 Tax=Candidatus Gottesmanbacteria bacterium GW2011_GWA2_43_14 TaxID=1618443 RepID=A0A0G1DE22_9BACT|nr:MAG: polyA polymerase, poly(A) polymerase [Candidatus Gottesmanbacteria bacterium GW2011_GWA2_43_14]
MKNKFKLSKEVSAIIVKMKKAGFDCYAVGGCVRDLVIGRPTNDWDFTTNATPDQIQKLFPDSFYDNKFGTVGIPMDRDNPYKKTVYEITTYRSEKGYSDFRHPDEIVFGQKLEEDLQRRDFTVNAMAYDGSEITDLFEGLKDLEKKIIRSVGKAPERFNEDALRMMRAVRLASELGFVIEEKTFQAITDNAKLINKISAERVREELLKILASAYPTEGIRLLRNSLLLAEILPELDKCFQVEQKSPKRHHTLDVGNHLLESLKNTPSRDPVVRLATLLHDVGKPPTFRKTDEGVITFYNHEIVGASIVRNIAARLHMSKKDSEKLVRLVRFHQFTVDERQTDSALRRFIKNVGKEYLADMLHLRTGDRLGGGARETSWRLELFKKRLLEVQKQPFSVTDLKANGRDVMEIYNIGSGPMVGSVLNMLFNDVSEGKLPNTREILLKRIKDLKKEITLKE